MGVSSPATRRSSVDFPEPEGPSTATVSPAAIRRSIEARTGCADAPRPKVRVTPRSSTAAGIPVSPGTGMGVSSWSWREDPVHDGT
ncbi:hypothetical protein ACLVWQ_05700 [Streptomyces sp. CWNU-52B]|uniref:hypothetical protein n=1 Tax=unclassified Streptomyces TaxID=2593676 RepID=UPI0039BF93C8